MKISPVNNNKQNTNFGMVKVVDANTPELVHEAWRLLINMLPSHEKRSPFRVADALNPNYEPKARISPGPYEMEGGQYMGNHLHQEKLPTYAKEGDIFIFDGELNKRSELDNRSLAQRFDDAFSNPVRITIAKLREFAANIKEKKDALAQADKALADAKVSAVTTHNDICAALGADFLKIDLF